MTSLGLKPLVEAVKFRVFKQITSVIDDGAFTTMLILFDHEVLLGGFREVTPMTCWQWICSNSQSRRRKVLTKALAKLEARGFVPDGKVGLFSPFVKTEKLPWFKVVDGQPDCERAAYVARLIQAPHDETHLICGPWFKPFTHELKHRWSSDNWIYYASAAPEQLDCWLRQNQASDSWFWSDYSAFDSTWSNQAWDVIEEVYARYMPGLPEEFWEVLALWRCPRGMARCRQTGAKVSYTSGAMMASGRDDTACGNALLNGLVLAISFAAALGGVPTSEVKVEHLLSASELLSIAVVGDDSLVACRFDVDPYRAAIEKGIRSFGLMAVVETSHSLCDVTFLGMMPYLTHSGLFWGPTIGRRLYKSGWLDDPVAHPAAWYAGVATQLAQYACVPILYDLGEAALKLLEGTPVGTAGDPDDAYKPHKSRAVQTPKWDSATVGWMCQRYRGLQPWMFTRDLETIAMVNRLPAAIHSEVFLACVAQDDL